MKELNFNVKDGVNTLEIREGKALELKEPVKLDLSGIIDTVTRFLEKRMGTFEDKSAHILVDREVMTITLVTDEHNHYFDQVSGKLILNPDFTKWNINTGKAWNPKELSEFVKMNRACFDVRDTAMQLSAELSNIKVKVDKEFERSDNNRGDFRAVIAQKVIASNIPERFRLSLPIFKGTDPVSFEVEVYVSPDNYACTLVSPEANDFVFTVKNNIIDSQLDIIKELAPDIVVIEQ